MSTMDAFQHSQGSGTRAQSTHKLYHGPDVLPRLFLISSNGLAAQKSAFLRCIPMELDGAVLWREPVLGEDSKSFQNADCARAIVIGSRCWEQWEEVVHRILVCADDCQRCAEVGDLWFESRNDGWLRECMGEVLEGDVGMERSFLNNLLGKQAGQHGSQANLRQKVTLPLQCGHEAIGRSAPPFR